jgi:trk system potassium uptake protein TrkA
VIEDSRLVGSVKRSDVIEEYHRELMKRDLAGSFQGALAWTARAKNIDLGEGYMMAEMECPPDFVGKSLRELNARVHYGVEVILIRPAKKPGTEAVVVVSPDYRFINGDVLLVIGKKESVQSLMD